MNRGRTERKGLKAGIAKHFRTLEMELALFVNEEGWGLVERFETMKLCGRAKEGM
jgi:hypothetical protein